jgi:TPR repeat protein
LVYLLTLGNRDTGTGEEVATGNPEELRDTETTPASGDARRDSSITSLPGDRPRSITSNNDGSAVTGTTDKTAEAEDIAPPRNPTLEKEKENRSQKLISRFLADESNDEQVREQKAVTEARKTAIAMSEQRQARQSAREADIHRLLSQARTAVEENRILTPDDDNAISLYQRVLDISPNNKRARRGLDVSADLLYEQAKQLYFDGQPDAALREINVALETLPGNEKLQQLKVSIESSFNPNSSYAKAEKLYYGVAGSKNRSRAAFYYRIAAERGHALAMNAIGVAYADGDGVPANDSEAIRWLKASAEKGNSEAMYNLALGYLFSTKENQEIAFSWVKKAADDKYRPAYALISWMSTTGTGTKANRFSSFGWELKGMFNPISEELHDQYRIPRGWQKKFAAAYKKSTIALP